MSLLTEELIDIRVYYTRKKTKYGSNQLIILDDSKAEKMLEDEEMRDSVEMINSKWQSLTWAAQNDLMRKTQRTGTDGVPDFDYIAYSQLRVSKCLKDWDIKDDAAARIEVTDNNIERMPAQIIRAMLDKYDEATSVSQEEEGNL
jgi:hypothetical protein